MHWFVHIHTTYSIKLFFSNIPQYYFINIYLFYWIILFHHILSDSFVDNFFCCCCSITKNTRTILFIFSPFVKYCVYKNCVFLWLFSIFFFGLQHYGKKTLARYLTIFSPFSNVAFKGNIFFFMAVLIRTVKLFFCRLLLWDFMSVFHYLFSMFLCFSTIRNLFIHAFLYPLSYS